MRREQAHSIRARRSWHSTQTGFRCGKILVQPKNGAEHTHIGIPTCATGGGGIVLFSRLSLLVPSHKEATLHLHVLYDCSICLDFILECAFRSNYEHVYNFEQIASPKVVTQPW